MMIPRQFIDLAVHFAVRQLAKYSTTIQWDKVKADLSKRVKDLIPGEFFDELAVTLLNKTIDVVAKFTADEVEMNAIIDLLQEKKFNEAFNKVRGFVMLTLGL